MLLQDLFIYPVKSLGGIRANEAGVMEKGFRHDRRFMLVDAQNRFITQRVQHRLALLQTAFRQNGLCIFQKKDPVKSIFISFDENMDESAAVTIWDDTVHAVFTGKKADDWFSDFLQQPVRLVFLPEENLRPVDPRYAFNDENVSLADGYPYLLISQASLDDLNARLAHPVPMNRFRPNIVISGTTPYAEDEWAEIAIGAVRFRVAKPCARCVLTTIDQQTAEKSKEPLATLSGFRLSGKKVLFGQNLIALNTGMIRVHDTVEVLKWK